MIDHLKHFLSERPAISKSCFCNEAGISRQLLGEIIKGRMKLTYNVKNKLIPILKKYGYECT